MEKRHNPVQSSGERASQDWVAVGKVTRPHGLKGEMKFRPFTKDEDILKDIGLVKLGRDENAGQELQVENLRGHYSKRIVKFKGFNSIESVQELSGDSLYIRREDFKALPEGEYYWFEIEGLNVYDEEGGYYGQVVEIMKTGSNDVYVVQDADKEILLPMIDSVVKVIDLEQGKLIFKNVEGLIEGTPV
jgi:16S rRNA processing protein RimM